MHEARLYSSRAAPVFSARTPENETTRSQSFGHAALALKTVGAYWYKDMVPASQSRMAVWSSEPPNVPTPLPPARSRKLCPFSAQARYMARSIPSWIFRRKIGVV